MNSGAEGRIRGSRRSPSGPDRGKGPSLTLLAVVSVSMHVLLLAALGYLPGFFERKPEKVVLYSITMTSLPGPAGGGGESPELREPDKNPVKEPPKEEVKLNRPVDKKARRPEKKEPEPAPRKPQAPVGPGQGPVGGGGKAGEETSPISVEGGLPFPFPDYIKHLVGKVSRAWTPPYGLASKKHKVVLFFRINRSGRISDITVKDSSGIGLLDRSAMSAVNDINKKAYWEPLPKEFQGDSLGVNYTFIPETSG
jgi:TonB family protein